MTYLGASVAALATDRNTWQSRANQAWGASRVWNSGSSFETDSQTWQGRANNAWGTSRVWNSGSSFETDLANMTTDRNNWQASSNTWQSRANQAWGASRTWSSGESWEAAYNRVLPPAAVIHLSSTGGTGSGSDGWQFACSVTIDRSGYWVCTAMGQNGGGPFVGARIRINGSVQTIQGAFNSGGINNGNPTAGVVYAGHLNAGDVVQADGYRGSFGTCNVFVDAYFNPTQGEPH